MSVVGSNVFPMPKILRIRARTEKYRTTSCGKASKKIHEKNFPERRNDQNPDRKRGKNIAKSKRQLKTVRRKLS